MNYENIIPIARQDAEIAFLSNDTRMICDALVRIAYHDPDWRWVQSHCLSFGKHTASEVRGLSVICIGHLVRIHGTIDEISAYLLLYELLEDPEVSGYAQDALDDINIYLQ